MRLEHPGTVYHVMARGHERGASYGEEANLSTAMPRGVISILPPSSEMEADTVTALLE